MTTVQSHDTHSYHHASMISLITDGPDMKCNGMDR